VISNSELLYDVSNTVKPMSHILPVRQLIRVEGLCCGS